MVTVSAFEAIGVTTAMPTVARELGNLSLYPVAFAIPLATSVIGMVLAGFWADRRGPRPVLVAGVALFVAGLLVAMLAPTMPVVIAGRTVMSLGAGLNVVVLYVIISLAFPEQLRPKVFAWDSMAWVAPALFGPPLAGFAVTHLSWRWVFGAGAVLAVPALLLMLPAVRGLAAGGDQEVTSGKREPAADAGAARAVLAAVGAAAGAAMLSLAAHSPGPAAALLVLAAVGLLMVTAPRLVPAGTYRLRPGPGAVILTRGLLAAAFMGTDVFLPLLLTQQHGWSPTAAGLTLTAGALSWSAAAWLGAKATDDDTRRRLIRLGLLMITVGIVVCVLSIPQGMPPWLVFIGWVLGGGGIGLGYSQLTVLLLGMTPTAQHGRISSALQTNEQLSIAVVLAVGAAVFGALSTANSGLAFALSLAVSALCGLAGLLVTARRLAS